MSHGASSTDGAGNPVAAAGGPSAREGRSGLAARLYDAAGQDRTVEPDAIDPRRLDDRQLLWIDLERRELEALERIGTLLDLAPETRTALASDLPRPRLARFERYIHLTILTVTPREDGLEPVRVDLVAARNVVLTVHDGPAPALEGSRVEIRGETSLGKLDSSSFVGVLIDRQLNGYFDALEAIERDLDRLDEAALRGPGDLDPILGRLIALRRRVGVLRRMIAPHREVYTALAHIDVDWLEDPIGSRLPSAVERFERAVEAVENAREEVIGSFDVVMTATARRTNEVVKILTLASVILLPASVLAGIMGMSFPLPFFEDGDNFWLVLGLIGAFTVAILVAARWSRWI